MMGEFGRVHIPMPPEDSTSASSFVLPMASEKIVAAPLQATSICLAAMASLIGAPEGNTTISISTPSSLKYPFSRAYCTGAPTADGMRPTLSGAAGFCSAAAPAKRNVVVIINSTSKETNFLFIFVPPLDEAWLLML